MGFGVIASALHQKQQAAGLSPKINLFKKIKKDKVIYHDHFPEPPKVEISCMRTNLILACAVLNFGADGMVVIFYT